MNEAVLKMDRDLLRYQNTYKVVADLNTDVCVEKLLKLGPQTKKDQPIYELTLFNLLNDVIRIAYKQGRNCLDD